MCGSDFCCFLMYWLAKPWRFTHRMQKSFSMYGTVRYHRIENEDEALSSIHVEYMCVLSYSGLHLSDRGVLALLNLDPVSLGVFKVQGFAESALSVPNTELHDNGHSVQQ